MNENYLFKKYYGLADYSLGLFLNSIEENFEILQKHDCSLKMNFLSEDNSIISEIEFHFYYWNILKFIDDINKNNIDIDKYFKHNYLNIIKKIYKYFKDNLIKYENLLFEFFINNWSIIKNIEINLLNIYFSDFLNSTFWLKKSLIIKNMKTMIEIVNFLSNDECFIHYILKNFSELNNELKEIVIRNIDIYFLNDSKFLNFNLIFELLKIHYKFVKNDFYLEEKIILVVKYFFNQSAVYKITFLEKFRNYFEKTKIINNEVIKFQLDNLKKSIDWNELKLIDIGKNEMIDNIFNFEEFQQNLIHKINDKKPIFVEFNKEQNKFTSIFEFTSTPENNLVKSYDNKTFNVLDISIYIELFNNLSNSYNNFFIKNIDEYYKYFIQTLDYLELIAYKFKFTKSEYLCINSWIHSIFESFNLLSDEKNLYRYQGYLYCLIQLIEFLIKKIYIFKNDFVEWKEEFRISQKLKIDELTENYKFNKLFYDFLSKSTVKIIYWLLYLNKDKRGRDLRNLFMHGDINTLCNDSFIAVFWLRILALSMIEEIYWNISKTLI